MASAETRTIHRRANAVLAVAALSLATLLGVVAVLPHIDWRPLADQTPITAITTPTTLMVAVAVAITATLCVATIGLRRIRRTARALVARHWPG